MSLSARERKKYREKNIKREREREKNEMSICVILNLITWLA